MIDPLEQAKALGSAADIVVKLMKTDKERLSQLVTLNEFCNDIYDGKYECRKDAFKDYMKIINTQEHTALIDMVGIAMFRDSSLFDPKLNNK